MASLNTSTNGPSIRSSYQGVINSPPPSGAATSSPTFAQWAIFSVSTPLVNAFQHDTGSKESVLKVQSTGEGELQDLIEDFSEGRVQFAFVKVKDPNTTLPKYVLIGWCGEGVPERTKGYFTSHLAAVSKILHVTARSDRDLTPESIVQKVADASGAKYSAGNAPSSAPGPAPPIASKPVFTPTQGGARSAYNPLGGTTSRKIIRDENVDADGWGTDAPQVTRSQLEKVQSAYQPTKVNMAELTKQKPEPSRFNGASHLETTTESGDIVKGGYQPIGKVDIAAIRAQAKKTEDYRPTIVKGAYEPVGKVDIAAIRAKAQKPVDEAPGHVSAVATKPSTAAGDSEEPKSLADRSAVFTQSERLTSLPKPKVAHKFVSSSFTGTKAPTPGVFGLQSAPTTAKAAPVGAASRTFADEGGKTPAQIWAEKKARQRGLSGAADTVSPAHVTPLTSQPSGSGEWKSGYTGKTWAPVATTVTGRSATSSIDQQRTGEQDRSRDEEEAPTSPAGGISALRDRFKGAAPMGAPVIPSTKTGDGDFPPPPVPSFSRPEVSPIGLPTRPQAHEEEEYEERGRPNIPSPPRIQRSPSPPTPEEREVSPVRIAIPVSRNKEPHFEAPEERIAAPSMPIRSLEKEIPREADIDKEPIHHDTARAVGVAAAETTFGHDASVSNENFPSAGKRALVQYDYEKAEDNEIELIEGDYVTHIEMVDDDWWMGTNSKGESGLFPSNYVELVEDGAQEEPAPPPVSRPSAVEQTQPPAAPAAPAAPELSKSGPTATALYDYEAAEDNELSFDENDKITGLEFPDEDWWFGHKGGKSGLFPSNYVQLDE